MGQYFHISVSVTGALRLSPRDFARSYRGVFFDDTGRPMSTKEARAVLRAELAQGHKIIPSQGCDHFDWEKGCLGHEEEGRGT